MKNGLKFVVPLLIISQMAGALFSDSKKAGPAVFEAAGAVRDDSAVITSFSEGAVIPKNMTSITVEWKPAPHSEYAVEYSSGDERRLYYSNIPAAKISCDGGFPSVFMLRLYVRCAGKIYAGPYVHVRRAEFPVQDSLVYRCVEPFFDPSKTGLVYVHDVPSGTKRLLFSAQGTCTGCHAFSASNALINVRKGLDRRLFAADREGFMNGTDIGTFSYSALSPDRRTMVLVSDSTSRIEKSDSVVEPFNMYYDKGTLTVRDIRSGAVLASSLKGTDEIRDMPVFSADGAKIYYCRYARTVPIRSIGIFCSDASLSNEIEIVHSNTGEFRYFPKTSPNGKWLSFVQGDASHGVFARKSSDIYLMNLRTRAVSKLELNSEGMESWHTWSSDSRWIAFARNRDPSRLTSIYLSFIDDSGRASPPFKIAGFDSKKTNMPVFAPGWEKAEQKELLDILYPQADGELHAE